MNPPQAQSALNLDPSRDDVQVSQLARKILQAIESLASPLTTSQTFQAAQDTRLRLLGSGKLLLPRKRAAEWQTEGAKESKAQRPALLVAPTASLRAPILPVKKVTPRAIRIPAREQLWNTGTLRKSRAPPLSLSLDVPEVDDDVVEMSAPPPKPAPKPGAAPPTPAALSLFGRATPSATPSAVAATLAVSAELSAAPPASQSTSPAAPAAVSPTSAPSSSSPAPPPSAASALAAITAAGGSSSGSTFSPGFTPAFSIAPATSSATQPASVSSKDSAAPAFTIGAPTEAASPAAPKEDGEKAAKPPAEAKPAAFEFA
eukprot:EG_transcript_17175